jgi:hypothetical protein
MNERGWTYSEHIRKINQHMTGLVESTTNVKAYSSYMLTAPSFDKIGINAAVEPSLSRYRYSFREVHRMSYFGNATSSYVKSVKLAAEQRRRFQNLTILDYLFTRFYSFISIFPCHPCTGYMTNQYNRHKKIPKNQKLTSTSSYITPLRNSSPTGSLSESNLTNDSILLNYSTALYTKSVSGS